MSACPSLRSNVLKLCNAVLEEAEMGVIASARADLLRMGVPIPQVMVSSCVLGYKVTYRSPATPSSQAAGDFDSPKSKRLRLGDTSRKVQPSRRGNRRNHREVLELLHRHSLLAIVPICPEMDVFGLSAPRPPLRLHRTGDGILPLLLEDGRGKPQQLAASVVEQQPSEVLSSAVADIEARYGPSWLPIGGVQTSAALCGFIGRTKSPSCGIGTARIYPSLAESAAHNPGVAGPPELGDGVFVAETIKHSELGQLPLLELNPKRGLSDETLSGFLCEAWSKSH